jgi:hypothetical protein
MSPAFIALDYLVLVVFPIIDSAEHRVILSRLFHRADGHGARMFPSLETLAQECRREPVLVEGVIRDAIARGVIEPYLFNGRPAYRTTVDLVLWMRCGKPVDVLLTTAAKSLISDPHDPHDPHDPQIPRPSLRAGAVPLEVPHADTHDPRLAQVRGVEARLRASTARVQPRRRSQWPARRAQ